MTATNPATTESRVWLEVIASAERRLFELGAERVVTVGALAQADIRLVARGMAPVSFHFEREGDAVVVIPDAAPDLTLDARRVLGPNIVLERAHLELCGIPLEVRVLRDAPKALDPYSAPTTAIPVFANPLPIADAPTMAIPVFANPGASAGPPTTEPPPVPRAPLGPTGTEVIRLSDLRPDRDPPRVLVPVPNVPKAALPGISTNDTTVFDAEAIVPEPPAKVAAHAPPQSSERRPELGAPPKKSRPAASIPAQVGAFAKEHPARAALSTLACGLTLAIALASVARARSGKDVAPPRGSVVAHPDVAVAVVAQVASARGNAEPPPSEHPATQVVTSTPVKEDAPQKAPPVTVVPAPKKAVPDPAVATAVADLMGGRTVEASHDYEVLARRPAGDPAIASAAHLLARAADPRCAGADAPASCPEIKR